MYAKLKVLQRQVELIHREAIEAMARPRLTTETKASLQRIAEEAHALGVKLNQATKDDELTLISNVKAFLKLSSQRSGGVTMALDLQAVGRTVGEIRKAKRLTQRQVADRAGLTVNYLSLLETGQRGASVDVINQLADALGVPSEFILFLAGNGKVKSGGSKELAGLMKATKDAIWALIAADSEVTKKQPGSPDH
jgi:transcriptional regulator with XRE-family HTH domain